MVAVRLHGRSPFVIGASGARATCPLRPRGRRTSWSLGSRRGDAKMASSDFGPTQERTVDVAVFSDDASLMRAEAEHVAELARAAIGARGRFLLALSGGSTPRRLYELLSRPPFLEGIDWSRVHVFWGDERCV